MQPLRITADRPSLEVSIGGHVTKWEYDIVALKLEQERLQARAGDSGPGLEELKEFAAFLVSQGLPEPAATVDTAQRLWSLVTVQFAQLKRSILAQIQEITKDA